MHFTWGQSGHPVSAKPRTTLPAESLPGGPSATGSQMPLMDVKAQVGNGNERLLFQRCLAERLPMSLLV